MPNGQHYKIRVVSTNYPIVGDNIQEISIIDTSSIEESQAHCSLYPNPFSTTLYVSTGESAQSVCIYDISGRLLKEQGVYAKQFNLDLSELRSGAYLLQVDYGDSRSVHRILKAE